MDERIIGRYRGQYEGPLLICLGGMHGNEHAGMSAIAEVFHLLASEQLHNPGFTFSGTLLGIKGNLPAIQLRQRFLSRDLNRMLLKEEIDQIRAIPVASRTPEEHECLALVELIEEEHLAHAPGITLLLDLHTTTAFGGVFSIAAEDDMSLSFAKGLHVPVILGIANSLKGTTIDYFNRPDQQFYSIVFEAGQHDDPDSISRSISVIINCMREIGLIRPIDVDSRHDGRLKELGHNLPAVTRLVYHYKIHPGEIFTMKEGYRNFDHIQKGDVLAQNMEGPVTAPCDGLILMPKYQALGDDGFFIVQEEDK